MVGMNLYNVCKLQTCRFEKIISRLGFHYIYTSNNTNKLRRISGFHSGGYEEYHFLGYDAVTLKMEAIRSSETSGKTQRTTRHHIPENDTLQINCILKVQT
jgi:hypothetical protein